MRQVIIKKIQYKYLSDIFSGKKKWEIRIADFSLQYGDRITFEAYIEGKEKPQKSLGVEVYNFGYYPGEVLETDQEKYEHIIQPVLTHYDKTLIFQYGLYKISLSGFSIIH